MDRVVTYRLNAKDHAELAALAEEKGVRLGTLTRTLVLEAIRKRKDPKKVAKAVLDAVESDPNLTGQLRRIALFIGEK